MIEEQTLIMIDKKELVGFASEKLATGYRLVQICCTKTGSGFEMTYSFDKDMNLVNARFTVVSGEEVQSISRIFHCAFLYENEIHDLFGIVIRNISIDYNGTLYRTSEPFPFAKEKKQEDAQGDK